MVAKLTLYLAMTSIAILSVALIASASVLAHRDGCHRWHSCPSDSGSYICGDLGYTSGCGETSPAPIPAPAPVIVPRAPIKSKENISRSEPIPYQILTRYDYREYPGFEKKVKAGTSGVRTTITTVSLTDGVETGRKVSSSAITTPPISEIIIKGRRTKPICKLYGIANSKPGFMGKNKGKFNIWGKCNPKSMVNLTIDNKRSNNIQTNPKGWFAFENIDIEKNRAWVKLYLNTNGKDKSVSEKTRVNIMTKKIETEYNIIHKKHN